LWSGAIPYLPTFDTKLDVKPFFEGYRFAKVSIEGVTHE
jgi:NADH-quinone oxidoreductase subunit G